MVLPQTNLYLYYHRCPRYVDLAKGSMGRNMGDCDHDDPAEGLDSQQCDKLGKRRSREEDELDSSLQHLLELRDSLSE